LPEAEEPATQRALLRDILGPLPFHGLLSLGVWPTRSEAMYRVLLLALLMMSLGLPASAAGTSDGRRGESAGQPARAKPDRGPGKLTPGNFAKVKDGKGKLTEADVVAVLGPATRFAKPGDVDVDLEMIWEEKARIRIKFKDGKASDFEGQFSEHLKSKAINLESFKKLKKGMSAKEVEKLIGPANEFSSPGGGIQYRTWEKFNLITVQFKEGKVSGALQMRSLKD
jgi:hypothetical protein